MTEAKEQVVKDITKDGKFITMSEEEEKTWRQSIRTVIKNKPKQDIYLDIDD